MRNKFIIIFYIIFANSILLAENIFIESKSISIDKKTQISIFENDVVVKTLDNNVISSDYAKYDKNKGIVILKGNIEAVDNQNNIIQTSYAEYNKLFNIFKSKGPTKIITSQKYNIESEDVTFDNNEKFINSRKKSIITDQDNNKIYLENFSYETINNIFKSIGLVRVKDKIDNTYNFSQIYIDTNKKVILGTDSKAYLNDKTFKINNKNNPRIFSNSLEINKEKKTFKKSVFTICGFRKDDKCPPWSVQASEMLHDNKKKTIYYDNAVIKVYNIPIFYFPKLSHPDPTVDRRSGFLPPSYTDTKNLGSGFSLPYYWAINKDRDLTFTNRIFVNENPLFLGQYRQAFKESDLNLDFGYTDGYKKNTATKTSGDKSHLFTSFVKNFKFKNNSKSSLKIKTQTVSNDKYLKLYRIKTDLIDFNEEVLENSIDFTFENDDLFFGFNSSAHETLKESYNDKYEYILPEITLDKNLVNNNIIGNINLQTNLNIHNYDTNKTSKFLVNDFDWNFKEFNLSNGLNSKILANIKNVNYDSKNIDNYKESTTNELFGAIGLLNEFNLEKKIKGFADQYLTPKFLLRYSPGNMKKENDGTMLNASDLFSLNRLDNINNFENGLNATIGFDYEIDGKNNDFSFTGGQIINNKENKKMAPITSLDEKVSDFVGNSSLNINDKIDLNYNFLIDQNYKQLNFSEVGAGFNLNPVKIDFSYLLESKHVGDNEYFKSKINFEKSDNTSFSFETKRNLITNSSEYYNLSYEYLNDCLRAGLVYRREFYNDSELEPENSLMFKITLVPFGQLDSPSINK
jgi:LPS-assembly protein